MLLLTVNQQLMNIKGVDGNVPEEAFHSADFLVVVPFIVDLSRNTVYDS